MKFSIIVGFRNRELSRVKNSLDSLAAQTMQDFELIFVDYGSDLEIAEEVKILVESYTFAKYIYNDTRGMLWNRAHALNTGVQFVKNDIVLFSDVDLIYDSFYLNKIKDLKFKDNFYTHNCYYLKDGDDFRTFDYKNRTISYVGLLVIKLEYLKKINFFNEFYQVWGVEDDDMNYRLEKLGLKRIELNPPEYKIYHQWHEIQSNTSPNIWYYNMVDYYYKNRDKINSDKIGRIYSKIDRVLIDKFIKGDFADCEKIELQHRLILSFLNFWINTHHYTECKCFYFEYEQQSDFKGKLSGFVQKINSFLQKQKLFNYRFVRKEKYENNHNLTNEVVEDYIFFFIGMNRKQIQDYYYENNNGVIKFLFLYKGIENL